MVPWCSWILTEGISIEFTSLQQRHSISLASFLQCPHFRSSHPGSFCKKREACNFNKKKLQHKCFPVNFEKFLRTLFSQKISSGCVWHLHEMRPDSTATYNISAAEALICSYGEEWWSKRLHCLIKIQMQHRTFSISFSGLKLIEKMKNDHTNFQ